MIAEASVGFVALIIVEVFPQGLIGIFGAADESSYYTDFAIKAFRVYPFSNFGYIDGEQK